MGFNFKRFFQGINIVPVSSSSVSSLGDIEVLDTVNKINFHNGTSPSPIVTEAHADQGANRLQNKDLDSITTNIVDSNDNTKKINFSVSSASSGTIASV